MNNYSKLSDSEKKRVITQMYIGDNQSFADIAKELNTYPNKILRDAKKFGIQIRDKSSAQQNALKTGKHKHPTKGQTRTEDTKNKIGTGVMKSWESLSDQELSDRKDKARAAWANLDEDTKNDILQKANDAVRVASKTGSKLEKFLLSALLQDGIKVDFHKEQTLLTTKLQIDLFLPTINVAIEVDGPSHFEPVWGDQALQRNISYDTKKQGLLLGKGLVLVRIKQNKDFSKTRAKLIYDQLKQIIDNITIQFPGPDNRTFTIEDSNG